MGYRLVDADIFQDDGKEVRLHFGKKYRVTEGPHKGTELTYDGWQGNKFANPTLVFRELGTDTAAAMGITPAKLEEI